MAIIRRFRPKEEAAPKAWPEPSEASMLALRNLCMKSPHFVDVAEKLLSHSSWQPGETVKIRDLADEIGLSPGLCCKFFVELHRIDAGMVFNRRPHQDDKVPHDGFTWHVDFDEMIRRAVSDAGADPE